jgi:FkbH-like protein
MGQPVHGKGGPAEVNAIKCLVWDLDNTIWNGILLEDDQVFLKEPVPGILDTLDDRGIVQSIASKGDYDAAMEKLREFGIDHYFLYPQIHWSPKSASVKKISERLNIGIDSVALIDDDGFERAEMKFSLPEVLCIDGDHLDQLVNLPELIPRYTTEDSRRRRVMYLEDMERSAAAAEFVGTKEEFLHTLRMKLTISEATEQDLRRAEELTVRTHQLNTTGYTYSHEELDHFRKSAQHRLLLASLEDKFGADGRIGLALVETGPDMWTIKLLLMSCRVLSRGVGTVMIHHIRNEARRNNVRLRAEMVSNERNRMMYMTFKFANFKEREKRRSCIILENDLDKIQEFPKYVHVTIDG